MTFNLRHNSSTFLVNNHLNYDINWSKLNTFVSDSEYIYDIFTLQKFISVVIFGYLIQVKMVYDRIFVWFFLVKWLPSIPHELNRTSQTENSWSWKPYSSKIIWKMADRELELMEVIMNIHLFVVAPLLVVTVKTFTL